MFAISRRCDVVMGREYQLRVWSIHKMEVNRVERFLVVFERVGRGLCEGGEWD